MAIPGTRPVGKPHRVGIAALNPPYQSCACQHQGARGRERRFILEGVAAGERRVKSSVSYYRGNVSIFAAKMKSFSCRPPILCVQISTVACPHPKVISG